MEIVKVTPYQDRGLLRYKLEWQDGDVRGVADTHCALTGHRLGANYSLCVRHCRMFGHFSKDMSHQIGLYTLNLIDAATLAAFIASHNHYPLDRYENDTTLDRLLEL